MGTPYRSIGVIIFKNLIYAAITSNLFLRIDNTVLKALESGNNILINILNDFISLYNLSAVEISLYCFFKQRLTAVGRIINNNILKIFIYLILMLMQSKPLIRNKNLLLMKFLAALINTRNTV